MEQGWTTLYRAGSLSMIAAGVLVLITIPLIPLLLPSLAPSGVASGLQSIQSQAVLYGTVWGLYLVSDVLYVIPFIALYLALRETNRAAGLTAAILTSIFVTIDVGADIPLRLSLIGLSNSYASANPAQQVAYLATGQLVMDLANLTALVATLIQFSAVILASYAMLGDKMFKRSSAYIGVVGGVLGLLFVPTFLLGSPLSGIFNLGGFVFLVVWSFLTGRTLYKLP